MTPHSILLLVASLLLHQPHPSLSSLITTHGRSRSLLPIFKETLDPNPVVHQFPYEDYQSQNLNSANSSPGDQDYQSQETNPVDQKFTYEDYQSQETSQQKDLDFKPDDQKFVYSDYESQDSDSKSALDFIPSAHQFDYHDYQSAYVEDESRARLDPNVEYVDAGFDYPDFDFNPPEGLNIPGIDLKNIDRQALVGILQPGGLLGTLLSLQQNPIFALALGGLAAFGSYVSFAILSQVGVFNAVSRIFSKMGSALFGSDDVDRMRRKRDVDDVATWVIVALEKFNENFSN